MIDLILLLLLLGLNIADIVSTNLVLRLGGVEKNKVIAWLMNVLGSKWEVVKIFIAFGGGGYLAVNGQTILLTVLCVFYAGVVGWNHYQRRKAKA